MRRRNRSRQDSSLELLLDTICNTFGGILFISLLVIILLQTTTPRRDEPVPPTSELAMVEADNLRKELTAELKRLQKMISENRELTDSLDAGEFRKLVRDFKKQRKLEQDALQQKSRTIGKNTTAQKTINQQVKTQQEHRRKLEAEQRRADALRKKVDDLVRKRSRDAVMPKEESAGATMIAKTCFFKRKKLYFDFSFPRVGNKTLVVEKSSPFYTTHGSGKARLLGKLGQYYRDRHFIQVFVWPDSFDEFEAFREILDDLKLKYRLVPMRNDDKVSRGIATQGQKIQGG